MNQKPELTLGRAVGLALLWQLPLSLITFQMIWKEPTPTARFAVFLQTFFIPVIAGFIHRSLLIWLLSFLFPLASWGLLCTLFWMSPTID
jgi:hypothetical protein